MKVAKPAYGEPCNRCGQCCERYPCPVGVLMFDKLTGVCPALERAGDAQNCGLVAHPERYDPYRAAIVGVRALREAALVLIGYGSGCDAQFVGEPINDAYRKSKEEELLYEPRPVPMNFIRALQVWGIVRSLTREKQDA